MPDERVDRAAGERRRSVRGLARGRVGSGDRGGSRRHERRARPRRDRRPGRLHGPRGHAPRQQALGRRRRLALQRRRHEPDAAERARRADRSRCLAGRDHGHARARRLRAAARGDGAREDAPLRVRSSRSARSSAATRRTSSSSRPSAPRACSWQGSRPASRSPSASSRSRRSSRRRRASARPPRPCARRSRWPTSSPGSGPVPASSVALSLQSRPR